jgi:hypothetical protein
MRGNFAASIVLLTVIALFPAGAMSVSNKAPIEHCSVVGGDKLPPLSGGSIAVCAEIERAVAAASPAAHYSAEVLVLSKSRLSATLVVDGHALPEQHFAIMDSELDAGAIQRFAASLARAVAGAAKAANGTAARTD